VRHLTRVAGTLDAGEYPNGKQDEHRQRLHRAYVAPIDGRVSDVLEPGERAVPAQRPARAATVPAPKVRDISTSRRVVEGHSCVGGPPARAERRSDPWRHHLVRMPAPHPVHWSISTSTGVACVQEPWELPSEPDTIRSLGGDQGHRRHGVGYTHTRWQPSTLSVYLRKMNVHWFA